jgi:hypothetical protein
MKKYALKYCLFLLPFAAAIALELFVLPGDFSPSGPGKRWS